MTDKIESQGKTVEAAISEALLKMGARRDEVEIKILDEPKAGFLGLLGGRQARVLVRRKPSRRGGARDYREDTDGYQPHNLSGGGRGSSRRRGGGRSETADEGRQEGRGGRGRRGGQGRQQEAGSKQGREERQDQPARAEGEARRSRGRRGGRGRRSGDGGQDARPEARQDSPQEARQGDRREPRQGGGRERRQAARQDNRGDVQPRAQAEAVAETRQERRPAETTPDKGQEKALKPRSQRGGGLGSRARRGKASPAAEVVTPKSEEPVVATPAEKPVAPVAPVAPEVRAEQVSEKAADAPAAPKARRAFGGLGSRIKERRKAKLAESKQAEGGETASGPSSAEAVPRRETPRVQADDRGSERRHSRAPMTRAGRDEVILEGIKATKYASPLRDVPESEWDKTLTDLTDGMLARAGFSCQCETHPGEYRQVRIATDDESAGMLIGRHGMTVDAIEHLVERMASNAAGDRVRMNLDINEYRLRREETLVERVAEAAERIRENGRPVHMEPMSARERRVVHLEAEKVEGLRTYTMFGSGGKHVVIAAQEEGADKAAAASDSSDDFPERDET